MENAEPAQASTEVAWPSAVELRSLLDEARPSTVLRLLEGEPPPNLSFYKAEALLDLDRTRESYEVLNPTLPQLSGEAFAEAGRIWSMVLVRMGLVDRSILNAQRASAAAVNADLRAAALAWSGVGFAYKRCWGLAQASLSRARELSPENPRLLVAQARVHLEADQRIEARQAYQRLAAHSKLWARAYGAWGLSYVAYLLGEFDLAQEKAEAGLGLSDEIIAPLFTLGQVALAREDLLGLSYVIEILAQRSPRSATLDFLNRELQNLSSLQENPGRRKHLVAFPTLVQRRDYCGPSTIELVLRYWKNDNNFTNDQIAEKVKFPQSGTPIYRMREFFHLVGFDTVRPLVPVDKLKKLIDLGFPVIIQQEFSNTSHVTVVIGYDELASVVELQDPMTHIITRIPEDELNRLRKNYLDSAVVAFPRGQGHEKILARHGLFDHTALVWCDQVALEMDEARLESAAALAERAANKLPRLGLAWIMLLHAQMEAWRKALRSQASPATGLAARLKQEGLSPQAARQRFYRLLDQARQHHPAAEFIHQFEGSAALLENDYLHAQQAFQKAVDADPNDARNRANLAECHYALRAYDKSHEEAIQALQVDPGIAAANVWMARSLVALELPDAEHFARCAVDLNPDWWLAHLALAESLLQTRLNNAAWREVELAQSLSPGQPEVLVLRAALLSMQAEASEAASLLQEVLGNRSLSPSLRYQAHQGLCRILFRAQMFDLAIDQVKQMLAGFPEDPWAAQFYAAAQCEWDLHQNLELDAEALGAIQRLYRKAVDANQSAAWVMQDYIQYLEHLAGASSALLEVEQYLRKFPERGDLVFLSGGLLARTGRTFEAAQAMEAALSKADGIKSRPELSQAVELILAGRGVEAGSQVLRTLPVPEGGVPVAERLRALGLALALSPEQNAETARELLRNALAEDAEDAQVMLRLGDVAQTEAERELCYRQALMSAPRWPFARANLANYLVDQGREADALEFTSGHESESLETLIAHGRALTSLAQYEEAISAFESALAEAGEADTFLLANLWFAQSRGGRHKAALKTARQGLKAFPDESRWYIRLANSYQDLGKIEESRNVIQRGQRKGLSEADVLRLEYETCWMEKDYQGALEALNRLAELGDEKAGDSKLGWAEEKRLHLWVALGYMDELRQFLDQENLEADGWGQAAWAMLSADQPEMALEMAERALMAEPENYYGLYTRSQALSDLGREEEAVTALHELRQNHPEEHNAYELLALRNAVAGEWQLALDLAENAVSLGSYCPLSWATRGLVHFLMGNPTEAEADLQAGWHRADQQHRQKSFHFWWLLAALQGQAELAEQRRLLALAEAHTGFSRQILECIEAGFPS